MFCDGCGAAVQPDPAFFQSLRKASRGACDCDATSSRLVLGFISLFNIRFGTAVGVYTLWVLLPAQSQQEYEALAASRSRVDWGALSRPS